MQYVRSKIFDLVWILWTAVFLPAIPVLMLMDKPTPYIRAISTFWARHTLNLLKWIVGIRYVECGVQNIPDAPFVIISNHQSTWETLYFVSKFPDTAIVAKRELLRIPVFGWYLKTFPMIIIDRTATIKSIRQLLEGSRKAASDLRPILIFPEGTRQSVSAKVELKRGVEAIYKILKIPVVPVALNSGMVWGPDRRFRRSGTITVSYMKPIPQGLTPDEFTTLAENTLQEEKDRLAAQVEDDARSRRCAAP
jgi:1-acyl-sn-glycerol-3-phosphate acyltransferase